MTNKVRQLCIKPSPSRFRKGALLVLILISPFFAAHRIHAQALGDPVDISPDFHKMEPVYFIGNRVTSFDPATGNGTLEWARYLRSTTLSFNKVDVAFAKGKSTEFPGTEYDENPQLPFSLTFVSPRTVRLRMSAHALALADTPSLMLVGNPPKDNSWQVAQTDKEITYTSAYGRVVIIKNPWHIEFYDHTGRLLTRTQNINDPHTYTIPIPFSFIRRANDLTRRIAPTFELSHDAKI